MNFYFNQLLNQALGGIDGQGLSNAAVKLGGVILIASLLYAVYEAFSHGGDVRQLGVAGIKYLALGLVLNQYQPIFRSINAAFDGVSDFMFNLSGAEDVGQSWMNAISQALGMQGGIESFWNLVMGNSSAVLGVLLEVLGFVILPITYTIFTLAYVVYGSVLYVVGPLVLGLIPTRTLGKLGTTYVINLMIFHSWALIYAILQVLMTAININDPTNLVNGGSFLKAFQGSSAMILLGVSSVILSICIALIPLLARRIISGDLGTSLMTVASSTVMAAGLMTQAAFGLAGAGKGGAVSGGDHAPTPPGDGRQAGIIHESRPPIPDIAGEQAGRKP
jgi:hypothetical protein